jgi:hypothetical protein
MSRKLSMAARFCQGSHCPRPISTGSWTGKGFEWSNKPEYPFSYLGGAGLGSVFSHALMATLIVAWTQPEFCDFSKLR